MSKKSCGRVNIPKVDNSQMDCDGFVLDTCVVVTDGYPYIGIDENVSLKDVFNAMINKIKDLEKKIENSEKKIITKKYI